MLLMSPQRKEVIMKTARSKYTVLQQICKIIPAYLISKLSRAYGVDKKVRTFSAWSHVVTMMHSQLSHSISLNDVVDSCRNHQGALSEIRRATPPSRNGLSYANRNRNPEMIEAAFWEMLSHMQKRFPQFGKNHRYSMLPRRFKKTIYAVDSTVINLVANCMDWAQHRRRKAAAKMHTGLNLNTFMPEFVIVEAARTHDSYIAKELCASLKAGEIVVFDKAYVDFRHLEMLNNRGVFWVTRSKKNMQYEVVGQHDVKGKIIADEIIRFTNINSKNRYPDKLRLVKAVVEVDGKEREMEFITNNLKWAASSVCDLYKSRWGIEVFFKQIKQTLKLSGFLGYSENAVRWQIWSAMLCYILLRFISFISKWRGSFSRLFTLIKGVLFSYYDIYSVINFCSSPRGSPRKIESITQMSIPGF